MRGEVCVFASELAAVLRQNKYVSFESSMLAVWKRNAPKRYQVAEARNKYIPPLVQAEEKVQNTRLLDLAEKAKLAQDVSTVQQQVTELPKLVEYAKIALQPASPPAAAMRALEAIMKSSIPEFSHPAAKLHDIAQVVNDDDDDDDNIKEITKFLTDMSNRDLTPRLAQELVTLAKHSFGTHAEQVVVQNKRIIANNSTLYSLRPVPGLVLVGRIDGFSNGKLVELKNRVSRFFPGVPYYERIQVYCYMLMCNVKEAEHIQIFRGKELPTTLQLPANWQSQFLNPNLERFLSSYDTLMRDTATQDLYFKRA